MKQCMFSKVELKASVSPALRIAMGLSKAGFLMDEVNGEYFIREPHTRRVDHEHGRLIFKADDLGPSEDEARVCGSTSESLSPSFEGRITFPGVDASTVSSRGSGLPDGYLTGGEAK